MRRWAALVIAATTVNLYWIDSDGDRTKTVLVMEYSDGTVDKVVVDKRDLLAKDKMRKVYEKANELLGKKGLTYGY